LLNIGKGNNLKNPGAITKMIPNIRNAGSNNLFIYNLVIKPARAPYSLGYIQTNHIIQNWFVNIIQKIHY